MTGQPQIVDARGLRCPLPVLKARKTLNAMAPGAELHLLADDPMAEIDLPHFCAEAGHSLLGADTPSDALGGTLYRIERGA